MFQVAIGVERPFFAGSMGKLSFTDDITTEIEIEPPSREKSMEILSVDPDTVIRVVFPLRSVKNPIHICRFGALPAILIPGGGKTVEVSFVIILFILLLPE